MYSCGYYTMEGMFSCEVDMHNLAEFCCACTFPLPCLCEECKETHWAKPGSHFKLALSMREKVTSQRDLARLQHRLHQLELTRQELRRVLYSFQSAATEVEATYQELVYLLSEARDKHISRLKATADVYEQRFNQAYQANCSNAWRGKEYRPVDSFENALWSHEPGEEVTFGLTYSVGTEKDLVDRMIQVSCELPVSGFPEYQVPAVALKPVELSPIPAEKSSFQTQKPALQGKVSGWTRLPTVNSYQLPVKLLTGETIMLEVTSVDTIQSVKNQIYATKGIVPDNQRLIFNGKLLRELNCTLGEYQVENGRSLHLIIY